jgi:lantibiotic modifying enzyme
MVSDTAPLLRTAAELGERLVAAAVRDHDRVTWLSYDVDETGDEPVVVEASAGADLYQGTAGIGWALARLAAMTQDAVAADVARSALRHALAHVPADVSLHGGRMGIAYAALEAGAALGDDDLVRAARALAAGVARACRRGDGDGDGRWDLMSGDAGVALALTAFGVDALTDAALAIARRLATAAVVEDEAWSWPSPESVEPPLCGLAHGASGAAVALSAVREAADTTEFDGAIAGALAYERMWFDRASGWPDLRGLTRLAVHSGQRAAYPVQWCHGAAGVGIARLRVARALPQGNRSLALTEAATATDLSTAAALRALAAPDADRSWLANVSICHGIGSAVELHLEAYAFTGDEAHLTHARRLMLRVLGLSPSPPQAGEHGTGNHGTGKHGTGNHGTGRHGQPRALLDVLPCGVPGAPEVPGLMLGTAGVIGLLLRLVTAGAIPPVDLPDIPAARKASNELRPAASACRHSAAPCS